MNGNATGTDDVIRHEFTKGLDRHTATNLLNTAIHDFMIEAEEFSELIADLDKDAEDDDGPQAPIKLIKAPAGIGKSTALRAAIKRYNSKYPNRRILYVVPSVELGEEFAKLTRDDGVGTIVGRGRSQMRPGATDRKDTMCRKADIAEMISALGTSVSDSLCRKKLASGEVVECPFASQCDYLIQQQEMKQGGLIIASHQYLAVRMDALKDIDLLIVDESYWQVLTAEKRIDTHRFTTWRSTGDGFRGKRGEGSHGFTDRRLDADIELADAIDAFHAITRRCERERRQPTLAEFRAENFTPELCKRLVGHEYSRARGLDIHPGLEYEVQKTRLEEAKVQEAFGFARIWKILGAELSTSREGEPHGLVFEHGIIDPKSKEVRNCIHCYWSRDPRIKNVPTVLIDADGSQEITERFFPGVEVIEINAQWQGVEVIQVFDKTGSAQALKGDRRRDEIYNTALDMADRLADYIAAGKTEEERLKRRPLLVSQKSVIDSYRESGWLEDATFDVAHMGNLRGKDGWKDAGGAVIAGRIEPNPLAIEAMMRGIWYKSEEPLTFLVAKEDGSLMLPRRPVEVQPEEGQAEIIMVSYHPDRRGHLVLVQVREAELMQAAARLRAIHGDTGIIRPIVFLTNIPLPVQPARLYKWSQTVPDRFDLPRLFGVVFEMAQDIADAFPDLFKTAGAVWTAASRREERAFPGFDGRAATLQNSIIYKIGSVRRWVRATFQRLNSGNRVGKVWLSVTGKIDAEELKARVLALLPDAYDFDLSMPAELAQEAAKTAPIKAAGIKFIRFAMLALSQMAGSEPAIYTAFPKPRNIFYEKRMC